MGSGRLSSATVVILSKSGVVHCGSGQLSSATVAILSKSGIVHCGVRSAQLSYCGDPE